MTVQHQQAGSKGLFYVEHENERAASMTYTVLSDKRIIIEHTEVDEVLRGKNIGLKLVHAAVEYARENALTMVTVCSFAKKVMEKKSEWQDVLENQ